MAGPISPGNYFETWMQDAWKKLPRGVEVEGNHRPKPGRSVFYATTGTPTRIDVLQNASDADGDRLTARLVQGPEHGTMIPNPDGSFTYTPPPKGTGKVDFSYVVSDGMAESEPGKAIINIAAPD